MQLNSFFFSHFSDEIERIIKTPLQNWKALLQDLCQKKFQKTPEYLVVSETGPEHKKFFKVNVVLKNSILGHGEGSSKKIAQQNAAEDALKHIEERIKSIS